MAHGIPHGIRHASSTRDMAYGIAHGIPHASSTRDMAYYMAYHMPVAQHTRQSTTYTAVSKRAKRLATWRAVARASAPLFSRHRTVLKCPLPAACINPVQRVAAHQATSLLTTGHTLLADSDSLLIQTPTLLADSHFSHTARSSVHRQVDPKASYACTHSTSANIRKRCSIDGESDSLCLSPLMSHSLYPP